MSSIFKVVGANIRKRRREAELTQEELAHMAGIERSYLSNIEAGKKNFSLGVLVDIAGALKLGVMDLMDGVK